MRRGPRYDMRVKETSDGNLAPLVPLELVHQFEDTPFVEWTDNGNGTYTLRPFKDIKTRR